MRRTLFVFFMMVLAGAALLSACGPQGGGDPAAATVDAYLQALVAKEDDRISTLSCAEWEEQALLEMDAFQAVQTELEGPDCEQTGTEGDTALVSCQGQILATYGEEQQEFPLSDRTYQVIQEGGEWRVCGYR